MNRHDLIDRVFNVKLNHLADLKVIFSENVHTSRTLLNTNPEQRAQVDDWIWTNLPDPSIANGELRAKVL